ncbi:MAG: hypothetical protein R3B70_41700, partial [Polyangiaceae bacterium]
DERDCCEHIVTAVDTWMGPGLPPFDYSLVAPCCGAGLVEATFEAHPSCTPWGPPMPPAMPCGFTRPRPVPAAFAAEVLA